MMMTVMMMMTTTTIMKKNGDQDNNKACSPVKHKRSKSAQGDSSREVAQKNGGSKKRPKIVELS